MTQDIIKIRLNMAKLKLKQKNKNGKDDSCPVCEAEEDATKHVLRCTKMPRYQCMETELHCSDNVSLLVGLVNYFR